MDLAESRDKDILTLTVHADRIDGRTAPGFHRAVSANLADNDRALVLDFSEVKYLSSTGLRVLLILARDMNRRGGSVGIKGANGPVRDVLEISGFDKLIGTLD